jgi:hypothetical protein
VRCEVARRACLGFQRSDRATAHGHRRMASALRFPIRGACLDTNATTSVSPHLHRPLSGLDFRAHFPHSSSTRRLHHGFTKGHAPGRPEYVGTPPVLATPIHLAALS